MGLTKYLLSSALVSTRSRLSYLRVRSRRTLRCTPHRPGSGSWNGASAEVVSERKPNGAGGRLRAVGNPSRERRQFSGSTPGGRRRRPDVAWAWPREERRLGSERRGTAGRRRPGEAGSRGSRGRREKCPGHCLHPYGSPRGRSRSPGAMRVQVKVNTAAQTPSRGPLLGLRSILYLPPPELIARAARWLLPTPVRSALGSCFLLVGGGEREGAPGCWGALKELGELGTGVETLVVPWSLVRRPDLELAITYLFCLDWHTCEVVWLFVHILFLHFGIVWFLVAHPRFTSSYDIEQVTEPLYFGFLIWKMGWGL